MAKKYFPICLDCIPKPQPVDDYNYCPIEPGQTCSLCGRKEEAPPCKTTSS